MKAGLVYPVNKWSLWGPTLMVSAGRKKEKNSKVGVTYNPVATAAVYLRTLPTHTHKTAGSIFRFAQGLSRYRQGWRSGALVTMRP